MLESAARQIEFAENILYAGVIPNQKKAGGGIFVLVRTDGTFGTSGTDGTRMRRNQKDFFHPSPSVPLRTLPAEPLIRPACEKTG